MNSGNDMLNSLTKNKLMPFVFTLEMVKSGIDPAQSMIALLNGEIGTADAFITKQQAQAWLDNGIFNRKLKDRNTKRLRDAMNDGDWMRINHGLAFQKEGRLIDGQHTLTAFIKSNLDVLYISLSVNIEEIAMLIAMDGGQKRQLDDHLSIQQQRYDENGNQEWVDQKEITIMNDAFCYSLGKIDGVSYLGRHLYNEKVEKYGHRDSIRWTMNLFLKDLGFLSKRKKNSSLFANALRAYDWVQRNEEYDNDDKDFQVERIITFVKICLGVEAAAIGEEWAGKARQFLEDSSKAASSRLHKKIRSLSGGGKEDRIELYLKMNKLLYLYMVSAVFNPKTKVQVATTEHFPFKEEEEGMEQRIAFKRQKKHEQRMAEVLRVAASEKKRLAKEKERMLRDIKRMDGEAKLEMMEKYREAYGEEAIVDEVEVVDDVVESLSVPTQIPETVEEEIVE